VGTSEEKVPYMNCDHRTKSRMNTLKNVEKTLKICILKVAIILFLCRGGTSEAGVVWGVEKMVPGYSSIFR
jgi:hypothetical protein